MTKVLVDLKRVSRTAPTTDVLDDSNVNVYMLNNLELNGLLGASFQQNMNTNTIVDNDNLAKTMTDQDNISKSATDLDSKSKSVTDRINTSKSLTDLESP